MKKVASVIYKLNELVKQNQHQKSFYIDQLRDSRYSTMNDHDSPGNSKRRGGVVMAQKSLKRHTSVGMPT